MQNMTTKGSLKSGVKEAFTRLGKHIGNESQ